MTSINIDLTTVFLEYEKKGLSLTLFSHLKSGKEADVYLVYEEKSKKYLALKFYKDNQNFSYKLYDPYLENVRINPKFKKLVKTKTFRGKRYMANLRTMREFEVMKRNYHQQEDMAKIPKVIDFSTQSILMDFIGEGKIPAKRLQEIKISNLEAEKYFLQILKLMQKLYQNKIIHSDLSPFNILVCQQSLYLIDFPQAIEVGINPRWKEYLARDLKNLIDYFRKYLNIEDFSLYQKLLEISK